MRKQPYAGASALEKGELEIEAKGETNGDVVITVDKN